MKELKIILGHVLWFLFHLLLGYATFPIHLFYLKNKEETRNSIKTGYNTLDQSLDLIYGVTSTAFDLLETFSFFVESLSAGVLAFLCFTVIQIVHIRKKIKSKTNRFLICLLLSIVLVFVIKIILRIIFLNLL